MANFDVVKWNSNSAYLSITDYFSHSLTTYSCVLNEKPKDVHSWSEEKGICNYIRCENPFSAIREAEKRKGKSLIDNEIKFIVEPHLSKVFEEKYIEWERDNAKAALNDFIETEIQKFKRWIDMLNNDKSNVGLKKRNIKIVVVNIYLEYLKNIESRNINKNMLFKSENAAIVNIAIGKISGWANGKFGKFEYDKSKYGYRFYETDHEMNYFLVSERGRDYNNCPILACGFIAYLIEHWGEGSRRIYDGYLQKQLDLYKLEHEKDADAFKRDFVKEFYVQYDECILIKRTEAIYSFLSENCVEKIKEYSQNYLAYVKQIDDTKVKKQVEKIEEISWVSEYELRQFIDIATRYNIWGNTLGEHEEKAMYETFFAPYVSEARNNFNKFQHQLRGKLLNVPKENMFVIGIDLKDRFLSEINIYLAWYHQHKNEMTNNYLKTYAYDPMFSIIESTKREILKYFPELKVEDESILREGECSEDNQSRMVCKSKEQIHYSWRFAPEKRKVLFDELTKSEYFPTNTNFNHFCFVFGGAPIPNDEEPFNPLCWLRDLQDLNAFVNTIYPNEASKWKKTAACFYYNSEAININSIKNLNPAHKDRPPSEAVFEQIKEMLKK